MKLTAKQWDNKVQKQTKFRKEEVRSIRQAALHQMHHYYFNINRATQTYLNMITCYNYKMQ